jgi:hypothetical protein
VHTGGNGPYERSGVAAKMAIIVTYRAKGVKSPSANSVLTEYAQRLLSPAPLPPVLHCCLVTRQYRGKCVRTAADRPLSKVLWRATNGGKGMAR